MESASPMEKAVATIDAQAKRLAAEILRTEDIVRLFLGTNIKEANYAAASLIETAASIRGQSHLLCLRLEQLADIGMAADRDTKTKEKPRRKWSMLVLSRKTNDSVIIGDDVEVTIVEIRGDKVRLGINAPKQTSVHRREVYELIHGSFPKEAS